MAAVRRAIFQRVDVGAGIIAQRCAQRGKEKGVAAHIHLCIWEKPAHQLQMPQMKALRRIGSGRITEGQRSLAMRFVKQSAGVRSIGRQHHKAARLEHAAHFRQRRRLIWNVIEHMVGYHAVYARVGQRQRLRIRLERQRVEPLLHRLTARRLRHAVRAIKRNHSTARSVKSVMIGARATADVGHGQARAKLEPRQRPIEKVVRAFAVERMRLLADAQPVRRGVLIDEIGRMDGER